MRSIIIETACLRLRPFKADDVDEIHRLWTNPGVRKFLWDDKVISREQAEEAVQESLALYENHGHGLWAVSLRAVTEMIGFCGYWFFHDPPELQLLYGLAPAYWGKGLATEAARAMIHYGFDSLAFDRIIASADAPNAASLRVMEKVGMTFEKRVDQNGLDTVYYSIRREQWQPDESSSKILPKGRLSVDTTYGQS
jgi:ribosomal-protein-alanine N-acetyltransferase